MFKVGDRVVTDTEDLLTGQAGEVVEVFEGFVPSIRVLLDEDKRKGYSPLWFESHELRKVDA
jgi:hypothetical protein